MTFRSVTEAATALGMTKRQLLDGTEREPQHAMLIRTIKDQIKTAARTEQGSGRAAAATVMGNEERDGTET